MLTTSSSFPVLAAPTIIPTRPSEASRVTSAATTKKPLKKDETSSFDLLKLEFENVVEAATNYQNILQRTARADPVLQKTIQETNEILVPSFLPPFFLTTIFF